MTFTIPLQWLVFFGAFFGAIVGGFVAWLVILYWMTREGN